PVKRINDENIVCVLACVVVAASAQCSYSSICSDHTMCIYSEVGSGCTNLKYSGVNTDEEKQAIVDEHNRVRAIVANGQESRGNPGPQPSAANMEKMQWDNDLAVVAQRWANQCNFGHDSCRNDARFYVGQNVYMGSSMGSPETGTEDWIAAVDAWYDEVALFSSSSVNPYVFGEDIGHYSQVVWSNSKYVGCGFAAWEGTDGWYNKYYVCNYGPGGNYIGGTVYDVGTACSECSGSCENGLCV
ncbi:hypothetical protein L9F63_014762, partial [Diploptera punctata]